MKTDFKIGTLESDFKANGIMYHISLTLTLSAISRLPSLLDEGYLN